MNRMVRNLYARGNMLVRKFGICDETVKMSLFKTYCYSLYCGTLWCNYKVAAWRKLKVCHNDIFRKLLNVPGFCSATALFVEKRMNNLDVLVRKSMYSLKDRIETSQNSLCMALCGSEARVHSHIWRNFYISLWGTEVLFF